MIGIRRLRHQIQPYAWGSTTALADLLGRPSPTPEPEAELWMGAHPKAPSKVEVGGRWVELPEVLAEDPEAWLGPSTAAVDGASLPYLFKVLAVARPLSIQAHPDPEEAAAGCRREDALGIPRDAPERNYRDDQAKPEIIYALTPFWLLRGFRPPAEIRLFLDLFGVAEHLPSLSDEDSLEPFFRAWMELDGSRLTDVLATLLSRAADHDGDVGDDEARWIPRLADDYPGDRGILAPLILNLGKIEPGEAVFTGPGVPHAYLEGLGVELMTNSDNVLRGGLTPKHVDVPELIRILRFAPEPLEGLEPSRAVSPPLDPPRGTAGVTSFEVLGSRIVLSVLEPAGDRPVEAAAGHGLEILLCTEGSGTVIAGGEELAWNRGDSFLVPAATGTYRVLGTGRLFRAGTA